MSLSAGAGATMSPALLESPEVGGVTETWDDPALLPAKGNGGAAARKRKAFGKGKATSSATMAAMPNPKLSKVAAGGDADGKDDTDAKDHIHIRARRGQATDSHILAERVRRERISERMKMKPALSSSLPAAAGWWP